MGHRDSLERCRIPEGEQDEARLCDAEGEVERLQEAERDEDHLHEHPDQQCDGGRRGAQETQTISRDKEQECDSLGASDDDREEKAGHQVA